MPVFQQATRKRGVPASPPHSLSLSGWYNNNACGGGESTADATLSVRLIQAKISSLSRSGAPVSALWWLAELPSLLVFLFYNSPGASLSSLAAASQKQCVKF